MIRAEFINYELYVNGVKWEGSKEETQTLMYQLRIQCERL